MNRFNHIQTGKASAIEAAVISKEELKKIKGGVINEDLQMA